MSRHAFRWALRAATAFALPALLAGAAARADQIPDPVVYPFQTWTRYIDDPAGTTSGEYIVMSGGGWTREYGKTGDRIEDANDLPDQLHHLLLEVKNPQLSGNLTFSPFVKVRRWTFLGTNKWVVQKDYGSMTLVPGASQVLPAVIYDDSELYKDSDAGFIRVKLGQSGISSPSNSLGLGIALLEDPPCSGLTALGEQCFTPNTGQDPVPLGPRLELIASDVRHPMHCANCSTGIVSWWRDCSVGITVEDHVGNHNAQYVSSVPSCGTGFDGFGLVSGGAGDDHYVVADHPALDFPGSWTADAWVQPSSLTGIRPILSKLDGDGRGYRVYLTGGNLAVERAGADDNQVVVSSTNLELDEWQHVAVVVNAQAGTVKLFVNGERTDPAEPLDAIGDTASAAPLVIGGAPASAPSVFFDGGIDEVHLFQVALSDAQVFEIFDADVTGMCTCSLVTDPSFEGASLQALFRTCGDPWLPGEWNAENASVVGSMSGISPYSGAEMLRVDAAALVASQANQVIDVSGRDEDIDSGTTETSVTVFANAPQAGVETTLILRAGESQNCNGTLVPTGGSEVEGINRATVSIQLDADPGTWQPISLSLLLPAGTRLLELQSSTPNSVIPAGGVFFDRARLSMNRPALAPLVPVASLGGLFGLAIALAWTARGRTGRR